MQYELVNKRVYARQIIHMYETTVTLRHSPTMGTCRLHGVQNEIGLMLALVLCGFCVFFVALERPCFP